MKVFFNQLFDYNFYCNKKIIEAAAELDVVPQKSIALFSEILNLHHIYNERIAKREPKFKFGQVQDVSTWGDIHYENQRNTFDITSESEDFEKRMDYENSEGQLRIHTMQDMLFHIINESTHYRALIDIDFKANGLEPLRTNYIIYKQ
ncbi:damage-inducible protein DinB [Zobellia roscoffensis]|uniref:damage-inducible protein DinB n=1 Tax=Zobellia roscoffensis TaxID=2779508 RepID=UPI00188A024F|nr:damage-inducible protein DinB [Zobellia roscoffensis]